MERVPVIKLLTDDAIKSKACGEVTNRKDLNMRNYRPHSGGLYDSKIFGSVDRCSCGRVRIVGKYCTGCHEMVVDSAEYARNFAYYSLSIPYVAFYKLPALQEKLKSYGINVQLKKIQDLWSLFFDIRELDDTHKLPEGAGPEAWEDTFGDEEPFDAFNPTITLKKGEKSYGLLVRDLLPIGDLNDNPDTNRQYIGANGLLKLREFKTKDGRDFGWINEFVNTLLPISSPKFREISYFWLNGELKAYTPSATSDYQCIIYFNEIIDERMNHFPSMVDRATISCVLNSLVNKAMESNELLQPSRESLVRNMVPTRSGRTIRSNIISAPDIEIDQVFLPRSLVYYALQSDIIENMKGTDEPNKLRAYLNADPEAISTMYDIIDHSVCTLCRNPSLHKFSVLAFKIMLWDKVAIGLPNLVCEGFNADFDGDQMWLQIITDRGMADSLVSMFPSNLWFYEKNMRSPYVPKHETLFGLHVATQITPGGKLRLFNSLNEAEDAYEKGVIKIGQPIMIMNKETTYGRAKLVDIIGSDVFELNDPDLHDIKTYGVTDQNIGTLVSMLYAKSDRTTRLLNLQTFGDTVATLDGLSSVPFANIYRNDPEKVRGILKQLEDNVPIEIVLKDLKDYTEETMKETIHNLPDNNIEAMIKGSGRVKISNLVDMYAPTIRVSEIDDERNIRFDATNIFSGLDEQSFMENAYYQRQMLQMKQDLTPVSGYDQRQLVNAEIKLVYDSENESPDDRGVCLKLKDAIGRTTLKGNQITKEESMKNPEMIVKVKSCINNDSNIVYKNEISQQPGRYSVQNGAYIGVSFASSLTEAVTQGALGLKHGGTLNETEGEQIVAVEPGEVKKISKDFIEVQGNHLYRYRLTKYVSPDYKIMVGVKVTKGTVLARSTKTIRIDHKLSKFNSLTDCNVAGDLGHTIPTCISYAPVSGVLNYYGDDLYIGDLAVGLNQDYLYYYPDGYEVKQGDRLCSGVLDVSQYLVLSGDISWTYYCFYENLKSIFGNINSELAETLFKSIREAGFSVQKRMYSEKDFILRMYSGATKSGLKDLLTGATLRSVESGNEGVNMPVDNTAILPFIMTDWGN